VAGTSRTDANSEDLMHNIRRRRASAITAVVATAVVTSLSLGSSQSQAAQTPAAVTVPPIPVVVSNTATNPAQVTGTVKISNLPATQPVSGTVTVGNLPATQPVSGTVTVGNLPDVQKVEVTNFPSGTGGGSADTVAVSNFPDVQKIAGTGIEGTLNVSEPAMNVFTDSAGCGSMDPIGAKLCDGVWSGPIRTNITVSLTVPSGVTPLVSTVIAKAPGDPASYSYVPMVKVATANNVQDFFVGRVTEIYVQKNATIRALVWFSANTSFTGSVQVDGVHLGA
jgi:hypothetical protein